MAPRMNRLLHAMRDRGALIIHAPSSCMEAYKDHPGREIAKTAPAAGNIPRAIGTPHSAHYGSILRSYLNTQRSGN